MTGAQQQRNFAYPPAPPILIYCKHLISPDFFPYPPRIWIVLRSIGVVNSFNELFVYLTFLLLFKGTVQRQVTGVESGTNG